MSSIDEINKLKVSGEHILEHFNRPALQGLGQNGVVGIGTSFLCHFPRSLEVDALDIDQEAHQLRNGQGRVGIVQLTPGVKMRPNLA